MTRTSRAVAAVCVIALLFAAVVLGVRSSYGAFKAGYTLTGTFDRAAYGFGINTEIDYLGIDEGKVTSIKLLPDHQVEAYLRVDSGFEVPTGTQAQVHNRSLFGDPYVDLVFPQTPPTSYLKGGDAIAITSVDADTAQLIKTATPLLDSINGQDLLTLVTALDQATQGEGPAIAESLHEGAQLAALYASTINAQIQALDSFTAFQTAITPDAADLNTLAAEANRALPTLNQAEDDFQQALESVNAFASKLANVISVERPDIDTLLQRGANVVRLLTMREPQIEQVVQGLAVYFQKFAQSAGAETLPNGTKFAYFKNFVAVNDIVNLICGLVAPPAGSAIPAPLSTLLNALAGAGLGCKTPTSAAPSAQSAAHDLINQVAGQIGAPEPPSPPLNIGSIIQSLLGHG